VNCAFIIDTNTLFFQELLETC